jgi:hypothetical protein
VHKSQLKTQQTKLEEQLVQLHAWIPEQVGVTLVADRGFGKRELYRLLESLHWDFVIRFRENIAVAHEGTTKPAAQWVAPNGHAWILVEAQVTGKRTEVPAVVTVKAYCSGKCGIDGLAPIRRRAAAGKRAPAARVTGARWRRLARTDPASVAAV